VTISNTYGVYTALLLLFFTGAARVPHPPNNNRAEYLLQYSCITSAFFDFVQMYVHHVHIYVQTRRLAHGPFQLAVH
jgi:hypothetical protein